MKFAFSFKYRNAGIICGMEHAKNGVRNGKG